MRANIVDAHIGGRLRGERLRLGLSPAALGKVLGLSAQEVEDAEKGLRRLRVAELFKAAKLFDVDVGHFYEGLKDPEAALSIC